MAEADVTLITASESSDSNSSQGLSTQDKLVNALMDSPAPSEDKPKKPKANSVTTTETAITDFSTDEDAPETEEAEEETEGEDQDDEDEEEPEEDEEEPETEEGDEDTEAESEEESETVYTTPDGEEVTLDELKRGYLRQSDYTKKTQEIAEARNHAKELFSQVNQHNQVLAEHLNLALEVLEPQLVELGATDWDKLARQDAYEYAERRAKFDQAQIRYQGIRQAAQENVKALQQQQAIKQQQRLQEEQQALMMALPDLGDPKVGPKLSRDIKEYALRDVGLSPEEAANLTDHRLVVVLNKARLYDEVIKAQSTVARKKMSKSPKRVASAGQPSSKAENSNRKMAELRNRVKSSGSSDDLVALLLAN